MTNKEFKLDINKQMELFWIIFLIILIILGFTKTPISWLIGLFLYLIEQFV